MTETIAAIGTVLSVDAASGLIYCSFRSGMWSGIPVRPMYDSYCDGLRVSQRPLPMPFTTGIVLFPNGDYRNGVWLGSYYANQHDALMGDENDPHVDLYSHWSGYWRLLDKGGTLAQQWPDATYFVAGSGNILPMIFRHIVDGSQKQQRVESTFDDRVKQKQKPFYYNFNHAAGTSFVVDPSGAFTATGGASAHWSMLFGGTTLSLDVSGNLSTFGASGAALDMEFNGGKVQVDAAGNVTLIVPGGKKITMATGASGNDTLALVSLLVTAFNTHTHPGDSGGTTGPPTTPWTAATIQSTLFSVT